MRPRVNWRFLLVFAIALVVGLAALHFVHRWQVRSQSGAFLRQADDARAVGDDAREIRYLQRYLAAHPDVIDRRDRLARLLVKTATNDKELQNAYLVVDDTLRRDPTRTEFRRFAAEFALERVGLVREAKGHLAELLKAVPNDGDLEAKYALCLRYEGEFRSAAEWYQKAYTHKPDLLDAYAGRARLLREHLGDPDEADRVMTVMAEKNRGDARAHLIHADYWTKYGRPERVTAALAEARAIAPDDLGVILATAESARNAASAARLRRDAKTAEAKLAEARATLDRGRDLHPKSAPVYVARAALDEGDPSAAVAVLTAGLKAVPGDPALLLALLDHQIGQGDPSAVSATLAEAEKAGVASNRLAYARARLLMLREDWPAAARTLEKVRADATADPQLARAASLLLGRCASRTGEAERRLEAYTRAIPADPADPLWVPATTGRAEALAALGRADDAVRVYQNLAESGQAPAAWVPVARLRMLQALRTTDPDRRDWAAAEEAVGRAVKELPDDTEPQLLRADLLALRGRAADARPLIDDLFAKRPKEPAVWVAKAAQEYRDRSPAAAVAVLEKGRAELGDPIELRLAQVGYVLDPKAPEASKRLSALADGADRYPVASRHRLLRAVAEAAAAIGVNDLADRMWDEVVAVRPDDLSAHLMRFDRRLAADDEVGLGRASAEIRRVDGADGAFTRAARALLLIWKAQRQGDRGGLAEAATLLDGLERDRPGWSRVAFGRAVILDLEGKPDAALSLFRQAFDRGERDPQVLRRLVALLVAKGRFAEANEVLTTLPGEASADPEARRLAAEVSLRSDDPKRALELAAKAVPADSASGADHLWLGQMRMAAGDAAGAEKPFRRAVELKPDDPDGWVVLVEYLVAVRRPGDAEAVIEQAKGKVRADALPLLLARSAALLGRSDEAREEFRKARTARPRDLKVLQAEADYLTAAQLWAAAREAWERVIALTGVPPEDKQFAVRMLAVCLAVDPDYATARRALDVFGPPAEGEPPVVRRTRAVVLGLQRDRANKRAAIKLLEADRDTLAPSDRYLLAQLYHQVGDRAAVRVTMTDLLRTAGRNPLYLAFFAGWLLDQGEAADAEPWVAKLETLQPDSLRSAELRVRVQVGKNDLAGARGVLKKLEERPTPPLGFLAALCEMVGLYPEAEGYLKRVASANRAPEATFALAGFYARRGRTADALVECEAAWKTCPPEAVGQACVEALAAAPDPAAAKRVAGWIEAARGKHPAAAPALLQQLAYVRNVEGRYDDAIDIYRGLTGGDRPDPLALNNLAYLISARSGRHEEALALLERARRVVGPIPDLLDTEALVLIARGGKDDLTTARKLLQDVVALAPTAATYFHLAVLEEKAGNRADAQIAWQEAQRRKLKPADLHPLEWPVFRDLESRWR
jgi:tetratricopeptide (TPR) repeat protein